MEQWYRHLVIDCSVCIVFCRVLSSRIVLDLTVPINVNNFRSDVDEALKKGKIDIGWAKSNLT